MARSEVTTGADARPAVARHAVSAKDAIEVGEPASVGVCPRRLERVREWMRRLVGAGRLPCAMTLIARRGVPVFLEGVGHADLEAGAAVDPGTVFRIYSMTKPITAVAAMMLYEEGAFQLDDPLHAYLPAFAEPRVYLGGDGDTVRTEPARRPIEIRDLLTHTAGFTYGSTRANAVDALYRERGVDFSDGGARLGDLVERLAGLPLLCHPGTAWNYSVATDVLGRLVEVLSGQSLAAFFGTRILEPLGMHDTGFELPAGALGRFAALYRRTDDDGIVLEESPAQSRFATPPTFHSGGGGLVSTIGDFYQFTRLLQGRGAVGEARLLSPKTIALMTRNHLPGNVDMAAMGQSRHSESTCDGIGFGLGFSVMLDPAAARIVGTPGEFAWGGAASTAFWCDPAEALTVIFMTQLLPSSAYPLRRQLRVLTYQALID
jgi:CubicO group peptidase (beta-lactamase class C family)